MHIKFSCIILVSMFVFTLVHATNHDFKSIEQSQQIEQGLAAAEQYKAISKNIDIKRYYGCLKAVGNVIFCSCLRDELPHVLTFESYVYIILKDKNEMIRKEKDKEIKTLIKKVFLVRNRCVARAFDNSSF